ncbi:cupin domain-containing protein [Kitasatospora sp. NPDC004240]
MILVPAAVPGTAPVFRRLIDPSHLPAAHGALTVETLPPGIRVEQHPSHRAESVTVVLSGRIRAAGRILGPGTGLYHPPGSSCGLTALSGVPAAVLTVRPRPVARAAPHLREPVPLDRPANRPNASDGPPGPLVRWLATERTVGARRVTVAAAVFAPEGGYGLHRHPRADQFFLVVEGGGHHLTETGEVPLHRGDLVFVPAGEWHGHRPRPGTATVALYGYLGAASPAQAGHQFLEPGTAAAA